MQNALFDPITKLRWPAAKANAWYDKQPWLVGCDYIPCNAINQLEMWQAETFDPKQIDKELGWAEEIGFNTLRVYLHDKAWSADAAGFKRRIGTFLDICAEHGIRPLFVFFDDCWNLGKQPEPRPSVHNSGWLQSPGPASVADPATWPRLEEYVTDILSTFAGDERVLLWDLYNEPGNSPKGIKPVELLRAVIGWARAVNPSQPLTIGIWGFSPDFADLNNFQLESSDILSFHNYLEAAKVEEQVKELQAHGRPLICTEYLARGAESTFQSILPIFKRERIAAINWGFVAGKTNTIFPWNTPEGAPVPTVWHHDIFRPDHTPFDPEEIRVIKELTGDASLR
jgi:hypothetical protein